jgi:hypothetical protein
MQSLAALAKDRSKRDNCPAGHITELGELSSASAFQGGNVCVFPSVKDTVWSYYVFFSL